MQKRLLSILATAILIAGCMPARNIKTLDSRLSALQKQNHQLTSELKVIKENASKNEQMLRTQYASLKAEFKNFREDAQSLKGELQQTRYMLEQHIASVKTDQTKKERRTHELNQILLARIAQLEKYLGLETTPDILDKEPTEQTKEGETAAVTGKDRTDTDTQAPPLTSEEDVYASALRTFKRGDYPAARDLFKKLLKAYPDSKMCDNARFWIGETYYREKWYEKAILEYQNVITNYPDGNKIPAALLKQGLSFYNIDDYTNARRVLKNLIEKFPDANEAKIAQQKINEL